MQAKHSGKLRIKMPLPGLLVPTCHVQIWDPYKEPCTEFLSFLETQRPPGVDLRASHIVGLQIGRHPCRVVSSWVGLYLISLSSHLEQVTGWKEAGRRSGLRGMVTPSLQDWSGAQGAYLAVRHQ